MFFYITSCEWSTLTKILIFIICFTSCLLDQVFIFHSNCMSLRQWRIFYHLSYGLEHSFPCSYLNAHFTQLCSSSFYRSHPRTRFQKTWGRPSFSFISQALLHLEDPCNPRGAAAGLHGQWCLRVHPPSGATWRMTLENPIQCSYRWKTVHNYLSLRT